MTEHLGTYIALRPGDAVRVRDPGDLHLDGGQVVAEYLGPSPLDADAVVVMMPGGYVRVAPAAEWERLA